MLKKLGKFHCPLKIKKDKNTKLVVGLQGISKGVGTTHIALSFATFFYKWMGLHTCYIQYGDKEGLSSYVAYKKLPKEDELGCVLYQNTLCYFSPSKEEYLKIMNKGYECIVIDFPYDLSLEQNYEFLRCDRKFLVCSFKDWNFLNTRNYFQKHKDLHKVNIEVLLNLSSKREKNDFYKLCGYLAYLYPYQSEPFLISEESIKVLGEIFYK